MNNQINERPVCPHNDVCGGCIYQEMSYGQQADKKGRDVLEFMSKKGADLTRLRHPFEAGDLKLAPQLYEYRDKMEYTFGDMTKGGPMTLGMHQSGHFMNIITVDQCQLVHPDFNIVLRAVLDFCNRKGYPKYNAKNHQGLMRNLIVRMGQRTDEILINIVTSSQLDFDEAEFVRTIEEIVQPKLNGAIVGILHTINDRLADAVYADELRVLSGRDYYMEEICGLKFRVSAFSFFQTNVPAVERLYTDAISLIDDFEGKEVFDLFCGTGTISQILAQKAKHVTGIEIVEDAVKSARENAELNGLTNCEFIAGDVFEALGKVSTLPDVIVVDPPRVGITPKALDKICQYGLNQILYISCNPKTLAENIVYMTEYYGYYPVELRAYDNFPFTKHIESVCLLTK